MSGPRIEYEKTDADLKAVTRVGVGIAVVAVAVALALVPILHGLVARQARATRPRRPSAATEPNRQAPEPRLQGRAVRRLGGPEGEAAGAAGELRVGGREPTGVTRVPIEQAMKMVLERGLPVRTSPPATCGVARAAAGRPSVSARVLALLGALAAAAPALAQERPPALRDVGFDQRLDQRVPGDIGAARRGRAAR